MLARHGLNLEVFAALLTFVAHQLQFYIQGHPIYSASVEALWPPGSVVAKSCPCLREGEWPHGLHLPKVAPIVPFDSMYMDVEREARGAVALFGKCELESAS